MKRALFIIIPYICCLSSWQMKAQADSIHTRHFSTNETGVIYEYERYTEPTTRNWHYVSLYSSVKTASFVWVPQINWANRLFPSYSDVNSNGFQYQLDFYPKLSRRLYLFGSYAYSNSAIFPGHKAALELYGAVGKGWETSLGGRYMKFDSHLIAYTASLSKYVDNYWISLRALLLNEKKTNSIQPAFTLIGRSYFKNEKDYMQVNLNYGILAEDVNYFYESRLANLLHSVGAGVSVKKKTYRNLVLQFGVSYRWEEYKNDNSRHVWGIQTALIYR